jgi:hypothetical protein
MTGRSSVYDTAQWASPGRGADAQTQVRFDETYLLRLTTVISGGTPMRIGTTEQAGPAPVFVHPFLLTRAACHDGQRLCQDDDSVGCFQVEPATRQFRLRM